MADDRLIEIMSEMLSEMRSLGADVRDIRADLKEFKEESRTRLERLEEQQKKTNLGLTEMRLSNMKLAERIEEIVHLDQRVRVLENIVLPKAS
ncbi:MAG TPA: hypothetical protein VF598_14735 [Hymenobacter sp.]|jgi:Sec-independent protein translocase protein TatA